jgi:hypothetical protein
MATALTKISDLTGNYRVPAGISNDVIEATLYENDELLLHELFDDETAAFILNNVAKPPATTLINGDGGLFYRWANLSLPFYFARTNFAIIGWQFDQKSYLAMHFATIFGLLARFRKELAKVNKKYWNTTAEVIDASQRIISLNKRTIAWLRVGSPILYDGNEATIAEILSDTLVEIGGNFQLNLNETKNFVILYKLKK